MKKLNWPWTTLIVVTALASVYDVKADENRTVSLGVTAGPAFWFSTLLPSVGVRFGYVLSSYLETGISVQYTWQNAYSAGQSVLGAYALSPTLHLRIRRSGSYIGALAGYGIIWINPVIPSSPTLKVPWNNGIIAGGELGHDFRLNETITIGLEGRVILFPCTGGVEVGGLFQQPEIDALANLKLWL